MNQELQPGQSLHNGRYTVKQELGRGRFAITYLADRDDGERWVIKILDPVVVASVQPLEEQRRLEDMFWQEAVALARCGSRSPYIVKVDRPFRENGVACLPLEYMGNNTLADRLERVLPEAVALGYIGQVGEALAIVHGENLVHRDVRPANIFLVPRKDKIEAVLTDFGLAMSFDAELTRTRTREQIKGFSPIELFASGQKVGAYTDVYSLAATLYEMLTGEVPVDALTRKLQGIPLVNPRQKNPDITEQTVQAILEGLALEPEHRPQTLAAWLKSLGITTATPQPKDSEERKNTNWDKWGVISTVVLGVLGLIVTIWIDKSSPEPDPDPQPTTEQQQP